MKNTERKDLLTGVGLLAAFVLWTILVRFVDVKAAGPNGTAVGFSAFNVWFHQLTGVHMTIYTITDWLGFVPFLVCLFFGAIGLVQLVRGRSLLRVDRDILLLGVYYIVVIAAYLLFEKVALNYRPILIEGKLEASYPSSTTLLVLSVMPTLKLQADRRVADPSVRTAVTVFVIAFSAFMVVGRLIAGVHWATDIAGGALLSAGLFLVYRFAVRAFPEQKSEGRHLKKV